MKIILEDDSVRVREIDVWNCHPHPLSHDDMCPYQVTDDLTESRFFVTHRRSDGAAVLAEIILAKLNDYFFMKEIQDEKDKKDEKKEKEEAYSEEPQKSSGQVVVLKSEGASQLHV